MNKAPWYKFDTADWLSNRVIRYMTAEQRGYLVNLRAEMWESDIRGTLPDDPEILWRLAGAESRERFEETNTPVLGLFRSSAGLLLCPLLMEQAKNLKQTSAARSLAGKASGASRRAKATSNICSTNDEHTGTDTDTDSDSEVKQDSEVDTESEAKPPRYESKSEQRIRRNRKNLVKGLEQHLNAIAKDKSLSTNWDEREKELNEQKKQLLARYGNNAEVH